MQQKTSSARILRLGQGFQGLEGEAEGALSEKFDGLQKTAQVWEVLVSKELWRSGPWCSLAAPPGDRTARAAAKRPEIRQGQSRVFSTSEPTSQAATVLPFSRT